MAEERHCSECGCKLPADAPQGMCPQCLMKLGLPSGTQVQASENNTAESARATLSGPPDSELVLVGHRIGNYLIKGVIAIGGMGCVYEAIQEQPQRTVALKVMKQSLVSRSALRRFEYETQILAHLQHPNIAQIYEAGTYRREAEHEGSTGIPYFAMEYIPNARTIIEYADSKRLDTRERLDLFAQICDAVHYGHQKGVIHRDLKPGNILIDSSGQPKIIDFGVARATNADMAVTTLQTDVGKLIGTLQYMSPEQCEADPHDLDTRSDVYALGVILYELLCGRLPYDVSEAAVHEAIRVICEESPVKPSTINKRLKGDIETITLKAQEKDKARRYQSAADLAQDIRRHLNNEPTRARRISRLALAWRWRRRNPVVAGLLGATAMLLLSVAVVAIVGYLAAARERDGANRNLYVAHMRLAHRAWESGDLSRVEGLLGRYRSGDNRPDFRGWEWFYLNGLCQGDLITLPQAGYIVCWSPDGRRLATGTGQQEGRPLLNNAIRIWDADTGRQLLILRGHTKTVESIAWSPDGRRLATISPDGQTRTIKVWNPTTGEQIHSLDVSGSIRLSPDVRLLAAATKNESQPVVEIWNLAAGKVLHTLRGHQNSVRSTSWNPESRCIATASEDAIKLWDAESGDELFSLPGTRFGSVGFSPDGKHLALVGASQTTIWDATTGKVLKTLNTTKGGMSGTSVYWSPDGRHLAYLGGRRIHVCDVVSERFFTLKGHAEWVKSVAWSPDGLQLVSASLDHTVRIWNAATGDQVRILRGHTRQIFSVAWSPDGRRIASGASYGGVKLWDAADDLEATTLPGITSIAGAWSPNGRRIASAGREKGQAAIWDTATGSAVAILGDITGELKSVAWNPNDLLLATVTSHYDRARGKTIARVNVWDITNSARVSTLPEFTDRLVSVAWMPNSQHIVSVSSSPVQTPSDWTVQQWDAATGLQTQKFEIKAASVAVSPDARRVAAVQWAGVRKPNLRRPVTVTIWELATMKKTSTMQWREESHALNKTWAAWSPDGSLLASAGAVWNTATGKRVSTLDQYKGYWLPAAGFWSPDGRLLAFRGQIWNARTGKLLRTLSGFSSDTLAWSPDGRRLAATSGSTPGSKTAKIYDFVTSEEVLTLAGQSAKVISVAWSPDGRSLATAAKDGKLKVWDASTGYELAQYDPSPMWWGQMPSGFGEHFVEESKALGKYYSKILRQNPDDKQLWQRFALVQLGAGNEKGYRDACVKMLNRFGRTRDSISADLVAWTCVLAPEAVADVNQLIELAEQAVASDSASPAYLTTLGAALYRAGRFDDAAGRLKEAIENDSFGGTPATWLFLAMTEHHLGNKEQSHQLLDKAVEWMDRLTSQKSKGSPALSWDKQQELEILRGQAEAQIEP